MEIKKTRRGTSIATRLYFVVGIMGVLIVAELLTLRFAMNKLSAVRSFVGAESLWSKAQKNAVFNLQRYGNTRDEKDFQAFEESLRIPEGDHLARLELYKKNPDHDIIRRGFIEGHVHPDDVDPMVSLLLRFYWVSHLDRAIKIWGRGDELLAELQKAGKDYHSAVRNHRTDEARRIMGRIKEINDALTPLQEDFSNALGEGSRYLEHIVLFLLTIAVVMVEAIGLSLAFFTARAISRGLDELNDAAHRIGHGDFTTTVKAHSNDEIGELAHGLNRMGRLLKKSYSELESRVQERTMELSKLAGENARLYKEASLALRRRDEFLSLASHELKTPITSMLLQAQLLVRPGKEPDLEANKKFSVFMERQLMRINQLVEEMLDTSRVDLSKFNLNLTEFDLSALVRDITERFAPQFSKSEYQREIEAGIMVKADSYRLEQVVNNLLTNALKYAGGTKVTVRLRKEGKEVVLSVADRGPGVHPEDQSRIFNRFERAAYTDNVAGLGIGLYIARAIVQSHQGTIGLESSPGEGANFVVRLPQET